MYNQLINRFLLTLAINDLMMLLATFFIFSLPVITERMENISLINISSSLLVFFYPIAHTSHTCAVYTTILVSGYRYLGICHPFLVYRNNNNSRSIHIAITSAVVFSVVFNLPRCFEFQCVPCRSEIFHRMSIVVRPTMLMFSQAVMITYHIILNMIVKFLIPFIMLTTFNWKIIRTLHLSSLLRRRLHVMNHQIKASDLVCIKDLTDAGNLHIIVHKNKIVKETDKRNKAVTIALVLLVIQFLVYNSIAFTNNILEQISTISSNSFHYRFLTELSTISISLNSATTAIYYLILSSKYQIICKKTVFMFGKFLQNVKIFAKIRGR
uniref:G-protein coupled receptors family 1 profile domain-containing protein n=1 Tax=Brugia malayi TaxID=6279 RepID=A0A8L7T7T1_BRUMA